MAKGLLTIGYEGSEFTDFLATLLEAKVHTVIDVRDVPVSRKAGFSKNGLAKALEEAGIGYVHLKELGDPKEGRDAARAGNFDQFKRIYEARLRTTEAKIELQTAISMAQKVKACLLCYERDPKNCHRSLVAKHMSNRAEFRVTHLGVREGLATRKRPVVRNGERQSAREIG